MKEILFKGKRKDNGAWIESSSIHQFESGEVYLLIGRMWVEIAAETLGQFTGLTDKDGTKIFEGDVIKFNHSYNGESIHKVIFKDYGFNLSDFYVSCFDYPSEAFSEGTNYMEVIGNIYDNPELLEAKDEQS